jgi:hypothetical protein
MVVIQGEPSRVFLTIPTRGPLPMVKAPLIRSNDQQVPVLPLISGYAYGSRNQPPMISSANQSSLAKIGTHSLPDCQALQRLLTIRPLTIRRASLTSLATIIHNSTLVLGSTLVLQYLCTIVSLYHSIFVLQYTSIVVRLYYSIFVP